MKLFSLFFFCLVSASQSTPVSNPSVTDVAKVPRFDLDLTRGLRDLVDDLTSNLTDALQQAQDSFSAFAEGVESEWQEFLDRIDDRIQNFEDSVDEFVQTLMSWFSDFSDTVSSCIDDNRDSAEEMFKQTLDSVRDCGMSRVEAISEMIQSGVVLSGNASDTIQEVLNDVDDCYNTTGNEPISLAACLAGVVVDAELEATGLLAQVGYQVWTINVSLLTLPVALEACAGAGLVSAGIDTGTVFSDIASCVASEAVDYFTSNSSIELKKIKSAITSKLFQLSKF